MHYNQFILRKEKHMKIKEQYVDAQRRKRRKGCVFEPVEESKEHSDGTKMTPSCIFDTATKHQACDVISQTISSVDPNVIQRYVFSPASKRRKVHTWALQTRGQGPQIISVAVFREHSHVSIIELIFVATSPPYQGTGFGFQLVNSLFDKWASSESIAYVLTYADASAVGFFRRLGFTELVPFPREVMDPWVDRYSSSLLMCCQLTQRRFGPIQRPIHRAVEVLVFVDNIDKFAEEIWCHAIVMGCLENAVQIQYAYMLRVYCELLPISSSRLRDVQS